MKGKTKKSVLHAHSLSATCSFHLSVEGSFIKGISSSKKSVETWGRTQASKGCLLKSKQTKKQKNKNKSQTLKEFWMYYYEWYEHKHNMKQA